MSEQPERYVYDFDAPPAGSTDELRQLLGGKGANLVVMARDLGLPVPPGFTITTEACRAYLAGEWPNGLDAELREHVDRLGETLGRRLGDASNPLLVSVRSGAPVSMPGMMDTILNLGLNNACSDGLAAITGDAEFAADCLRRFREGYGAVIGREEIPDDPWMQLRQAVEAVFRSWNSDRARAYREREGIADDLATGVTVQAMVFGNRGPDSGTGVVFTRNPSTGEPYLYGDVLFNAQGEDVVAGTHATEPIASLDSRLPRVAADLRRFADVLERHQRDLCDIEFTIEDGKLWMLQVRVGKRSPRAALRMAIDMAEDESFPLTREEAVERVAPILSDPPRVFVRGANAPAPIAVGLPASPGVAQGLIVTTSDEAERVANEGHAVILIRKETSPEDVRGMASAVGILTARGGLASHAAVVARGWGIPAVVGASDVVPSESSVSFNGRVMAVGDSIAIDGSTGEVFANELPGTTEVAPEVATLLGWARDLGIVVAPKPEDQVAVSVGFATAFEPDAYPLTGEDILSSLAIKGASPIEALAGAIAAELAAIEPLIEELQNNAFVETAGDEQVRLTGAGKLAASDAFAAARATAGVDDARASQLLDEFHVLDARMKDIVTGWQVRDVGGEQILNDHSDAEYDDSLLEALAALDTDTAKWLDPLARPLRQFRVYRARLERALDTARAGDQRFVASPRVDSYHSVWFELHEHLIRLAGKKRTGTE